LAERGIDISHETVRFWWNRFGPMFAAEIIGTARIWATPAIFPLIYNCNSRDVVIVHINPIERPDVPKTAGEILNRINEISFNSSLMREMRSVSFVSKLIEDENILGRTMKHMLIHSIEADDVMRAMNVRSKFNADWEQVNMLMKVGRERADAWLAAHFDRLGKRSTIDIHQKYL
jgi:NTE family protein